MAVNDSNTPLHLLQPQYDIPYTIPSAEEIQRHLKRILNYLEKATPANLVNSESQQSVDKTSAIDEATTFATGDFRLTSYEWGVTYSGMLLAGEVCSDKRFTDYTLTRLQMIADLGRYFLDRSKTAPESSAIHTVVHPQALDDAGALCSAMIQAIQSGMDIGLDTLINNFIHYIRQKQYRLADGTLARNRPYANTLWLDDLFMSVPALAQMGKLRNDLTFFDDAANQLLRFSERMFIKEKGIYMHGWVQDMAIHPQFCWARANGWAIMAMVELLTVLPQDHPLHPPILKQMQDHSQGLAAYQSAKGFWHQLLDRNDSYQESSATAIITYAIARAVNLGLLDKTAFAPLAVLGWNAVATKINNAGQVEDTCVGTGMGFDQAFYCYRPVNVFAAHGYGPVLLAGSEVIQLLKKNKFQMVENSLQVQE